MSVWAGSLSCSEESSPDPPGPGDTLTKGVFGVRLPRTGQMDFAHTTKTKSIEERTTTSMKEEVVTGSKLAERARRNLNSHMAGCNKTATRH